MSIRTISNLGGLYNNTSTWVEGVVPNSSDDIVATATSGQLTVNVASAARSFDFTNYTNTLTVNNTWTVSGVALQTFVAAMGISGGTFNINITGAGASITSNGKTIPNLNLSGNKTLNDTLNVVNFTSSSGGIFTGNAINCSGNFTSGTSGIGGTTVFNFLGTNNTIDIGNYTGSGGLNINSAGSLTGGTVGIGLSTNTTLNYSGGTLSGMKIKMVGTPITINGNGAQFETFDFYGALLASTVNISSEFKVKYFNAIVANTTFIPTSQTQLSFAGAGLLNVTESMNIASNTLNNGGVIQYKPFVLALQTGVTHSINTLNINGFNGITSNTTISGRNAIIKSSSAGNRANINLVNPNESFISNTNITDINFTGPTTYILGSGSTITNSTNVTNGVIFPGSTVSGGAWTFVN